MQIIETGLTFGPLQPRAKTTLIVIHHSASPDVSTRTIHTWHRRRGWAGIGYHFVIRRDGRVERGRPQEAIGAHAGAGYNGHSLGVCLCGNFMQDTPDPRQLASLQALIVGLNQQYAVQNPQGMEVKLHRDVARTSCPGDLFPAQEIINISAIINRGGEQTVEEWKNQLQQQAQTAGLITQDHNPDDPAPKWFVLAVVLHLQERMQGDAQTETYGG